VDTGTVAIAAAVAGGAVAIAGNLATEFVRAWLTAKRERQARMLAGIDAAISAMKDIGESAQKSLIQPPFWPSLALVRPAREFAYEVSGEIQDKESVDEYFELLAAVSDANSHLLATWAFRTSKSGLNKRLDLARRLGEAEAKVIAAAVKRRDSIE